MQMRVPESASKESQRGMTLSLQSRSEGHLLSDLGTLIRVHGDLWMTEEEGKGRDEEKEEGRGEREEEKRGRGKEGD